MIRNPLHFSKRQQTLSITKKCNSISFIDFNVFCWRFEYNRFTWLEKFFYFYFHGSMYIVITYLLHWENELNKPLVNLYQLNGLKEIMSKVFIDNSKSTLHVKFPISSRSSGSNINIQSDESGAWIACRRGTGWLNCNTSVSTANVKFFPSLNLSNDHST